MLLEDPKKASAAGAEGGSSGRKWGVTRQPGTEPVGSGDDLALYPACVALVMVGAGAGRGSSPEKGVARFTIWCDDSRSFVKTRHPLQFSC